jgi:hypothetical protein
VDRPIAERVVAPVPVVRHDGDGEDTEALAEGGEELVADR